MQKRLVLLTGKGGVGKTTVVAALAVHAASLGMRPLVVELGHRESMRAVFGLDEIGFKPREVGLGVHAMSVDVDKAMLDYFTQHIPSRRIAKGILHNKVLERLFRFHVMDPSVYYITAIPSEVRAPQVATITLVAFALTVLATIYPAMRGAATEPAEALRYE